MIKYKKNKIKINKYYQNIKIKKIVKINYYIINKAIKKTNNKQK